MRFAKNVAWVLTPGIPTDLPTPRSFEEALGALLGTWRRTEVGAAVVFHDFVPPFSPAVEPWPEAGEAGDGDLATAIRPDPGAPASFTLAAPRRLLAVTLVSGPENRACCAAWTSR